MNPYKLTSQVSLAPDPQLSSMMEKFKQLGDAVSFSVVFNEVQRRKEVRDAAQSKMMGGPKPQVADQLIQESKMAQMPPMPQGMGAGPQGMPPQGMPPQGMPPGGGMPPQMAMGPQGGPPPQGLPEQSGIGQLPAPNMQNMADGGIVSFAGDDDSYVPFDSALEGPPDVMRVPTDEEDTPEEDEEDPYPRFDVRDAVGEYRSAMDKMMAEQQSNYDKYKAEREKFGSAYANAEARDKEMSQQYEDEARVQRGLPWLAAGAAMMGSSERGLGGLAQAIREGVPVYASGREKLSALKDKQRDFMQTVAEARRAEQRGDMDRLYELQQSMTAQKAQMAGVEAQLGLRQDEIGATLSAAMLKNQGAEKTEMQVYAPLIKQAQANLQEARESGDPEKIKAAENAFATLREDFSKVMAAKNAMDPKIKQQSMLAARQQINRDRSNVKSPLGAAQEALNRAQARYSTRQTPENYAAFQKAVANVKAQEAIIWQTAWLDPEEIQGAATEATTPATQSGPDLDNPPWAS